MHAPLEAGLQRDSPKWHLPRRPVTYLKDNTTVSTSPSCSQALSLGVLTPGGPAPQTQKGFNCPNVSWAVRPNHKWARFPNQKPEPEREPPGTPIPPRRTLALSEAETTASTPSCPSGWREADWWMCWEEQRCRQTQATFRSGSPKVHLPH